ncbi:hypothetical protein BKA04_001213 [Cryobacterium mesophilum]|uniref:hypothetical protein n=1 Tax=Terrimesophilobacter mesophilus TaxID=433647 RepID=UPI001425823D|nr:hypothetical protein [Terrimesophilobacter mesophilus]MBB5632990.1 hypothetical protein [Terrimesophilobacter mesophilus]
MADSATGGRFDPRFDPRFQPGYTPGPKESTPDAAAPPGSVPQHREAEAAPPDEVRGDASAVETAPEQRDTPLESDPPEPNPPEPDPPEPNPLERTLLVAGAVLVFGGIAIAFWANSVNYQYNSFGNGLSWQQLLLAAAWSLTAPMVTVGLAIGVGVMFRRAIAWKPPE